MRDTDLMQLALGLIPPWMVKACAFDAEKRRLDIEIDFARGGRFPCPHCGTADCPVHDTSMQDVAASRLLPASGLPARARGAHHVPRLRRQADRRAVGAGGLRLHAAVRGAGHDAVTAMPVAAAARLVGSTTPGCGASSITGSRRRVQRADYASVKRVAIDETAAKTRSRLRHAVRRYRSAARAVRHRRTRRQYGGSVRRRSRSPQRRCLPHQGGVHRHERAPSSRASTDNLTEAEITFDKFHAVKLVNDAVDKVRRAESKDRPELKRSRYLWLRNERHLSAEQSAEPRCALHACISRPRAPIGSASPSRRSTTSRHPRLGRALPRSLVQLGHPIAARADQGCSTHHHAPPRRHPRWFDIQDRQRPDRGHQQPRASRQGQGARLPLDPQPQGHHLPDCRQSSISGYPREIAGSR